MRAPVSLAGLRFLAGVMAAAMMFFGLASAAQEPEEQPPPSGQESANQESQPDEDQEAQEAEEPEPRLNKFEFQLEDGGIVVATAGPTRFDGENIADMRGGVEILYQDVKISCDEMQLNLETEEVVATGNVVFDQGQSRLSGSRLELNLEDKLGTVWEVSGSVSKDYFFVGDSVTKTGEDSYRVTNGIFTSCEEDLPAWSFRAKRVDVQAEGYAKARNATFRVKKAPVFYVPYMLWPVNQDRASGLLVPKPGYSVRRGVSLGLAYYQTLGRSYDTTFNVDIFAGGAPVGSLGGGNYLALGNEFRYHPTQGTRGKLQTYFVRDPEFDETRWKIELSHESRDLPLGFRGVIKVDDVSDFDFFRDFERRGDRNSRRQQYSYGFLTKNWGQHSVNVRFDNRETLISNNRSVELRQLPEVEYKLRSTRVGRTPLYMRMRSSVHLLDSKRSATLDGSYSRADLFPELTLPIRSKPWVSLSLTAGGRFTWWGDSLLRAEERSSPEDSQFRGSGLTRFSPTANVEVVGPSFSRIFEGGGKKWSRFKHVIEPRFRYNFIDEFEDFDRIPNFDEIDNLRGTDAGRFSLINRLLAKTTEEEGGSARQILSLELFQDVSFDADRPLQFSSDRSMVRAQGPLSTLLRYNPSRRTLLLARVAYNTLFSEIERTEFSGNVGFGKATAFGLRWARRVNAENGRTRTDQVRFSARFPVVPGKLSMVNSINYDIERSFAQSQRHVLAYRGCCYRINLEYADFRIGSRQDRQFRLLVTLKNVGTFLDITGGDSETL